jgi:probable F420-dependent oxidoreductase
LGIGAGADRGVIDAVAMAAQDCGFATLWSGEHVVMVDRSSSRYPYSDDGRIAIPAVADWIDPLIGLGFAAAATTTIDIATGVLLLPEHNPVIVAKQAATLDRLSAGRLTIGVGIGWSREEFDALGVPFERRGERTAEYVAAMRTLWREDIASFRGDFVNFDGIRVNPKPVRNRRIPIVLGGNSNAALRRVVAWADGWYGFNLADTDDAAGRVAVIRSLCRDAGRDPDELRLAVALRQPRPADVPTLADIGIDELVIVEGPPDGARAAADWVAALAQRWMAAAS